MPRKRSNGERQEHPDGPFTDLTDDIRAFLKKKRLEHDWGQREMGDRIGITSTAISNIETGKTDQIRRKILARYFRAFGESKATPKTETLEIEAVEQIAELAIDIPAADRVLAIAFLKKLANKP
jgi:transcriptional regulator with XRE-family HTH domain